jgi:aspartyl-tRNA synthetase
LSTRDPFTIKAAQFDMVLYVNEICSGGLRNYNPDVMKKCFEIAGYPIEAVEKNFSGLYTAFQYGAPPHGGCAFGIERVVSEILGIGESLREIVAFPANQRGQDLLMGSPNEVSEQQLRDVHIQVRKKN